MPTTGAHADVTIRRMREHESARVADLVRRAFASQATLYEDSSLPPLSETADSVLAAAHTGVVLVAEERGTIVGSVRGRSDAGVCSVGRLVVDPRACRQGVGRRLVERIEAEFPDAERFEIFTGHRSTPALRLYESLGYERVREEPVHDRLRLVHLSKRRVAGPAR